MSLWTVYWLFAKFGILCFGGGYILVPLISAELVITPDVENYAMLTQEMFGNLVAIAQMTPGPIGLNAATFVGYLTGASGEYNIVKGILGGIIGTCGLLFPGFVLVILASYYLKKCKESLVVQGILNGIRPASVALIMLAVVIFFGMSAFNGALPLAAWMNSLLTQTDFPEWPTFNIAGIGILAGATFITLHWKCNVIYLLLIAAVIGGLICR